MGNFFLFLIFESLLFFIVGADWFAAIFGAQVCSCFSALYGYACGRKEQEAIDDVRIGRKVQQARQESVDMALAARGTNPRVPASH